MANVRDAIFSQHFIRQYLHANEKDPKRCSNILPNAVDMDNNWVRCAPFEQMKNITPILITLPWPMEYNLNLFCYGIATFAFRFLFPFSRCARFFEHSFHYLFFIDMGFLFIENGYGNGLKDGRFPFEQQYKRTSMNGDREIPKGRSQIMTSNFSILTNNRSVFSNGELVFHRFRAILLNFQPIPFDGFRNKRCLAMDFGLIIRIFVKNQKQNLFVIFSPNLSLHSINMYLFKVFHSYA